METLAPVELSEYELERGKPIPSKNHGIIQANLLIELGSRYRKDYRFTSEISVGISGRVLVPDIGIFPRMEVNMAADQTMLEKMPLTTVEILSPSQALDDLVDKT